MRGATIEHGRSSVSTKGCFRRFIYLQFDISRPRINLFIAYGQYLGSKSIYSLFEFRLSMNLLHFFFNKDYR